jgi:hypothetical protein
MNALKLEMVTTMLAFAIAGLASDTPGNNPPRERSYMRFREAIRYHELILALYQQINFCLDDMPRECYLASVIVGDTQFIILGNIGEWDWFFRLRWEYLLNFCPCAISMN